MSVTDSEKLFFEKSPDLMSYLPLYLHGFKEMQLLNNTASHELAQLFANKDDLFKQCFVDTATWGLDCWEKELEITNDKSKSYEARREVIKAKMIGHGTVTKELIRNTAESFSGGEVNVVEHPETNSFTIKFVGVKGIPRNLKTFEKSINDIKPAHLSFDFAFTYNVWNFLYEKHLTWLEANKKTWDEIRVFY